MSVRDTLIVIITNNVVVSVTINVGLGLGLPVPPLSVVGINKYPKPEGPLVIAAANPTG